MLKLNGSDSKLELMAEFYDNVNEFPRSIDTGNFLIRGAFTD